MKDSLIVKVVNNSKHPLPEYSTSQSAGMDLRANLESSIALNPFERRLIPTGLFVELPLGYEAQIRPRSGLALKKGLTVLNAPGTIDSDYRGEVGVILINMNEDKVIIEDGERIAQMIVSKHETISWARVDVLEKTERDEGGFGHTGRL